MSQVMNEFFRIMSEQEPGLKKTAAERDKLYGVTPESDMIGEAHPKGGTETMGAGGPGGVGVYNVKPVKLTGGPKHMDLKVEDVKEIHDQALAVAQREPKGDPKPTPGNDPMKWPEKLAKKEENTIVTQGESKPGLSKKAAIIQDLVKLANTLDEKGLADEATMLDKIIESEVNNTEK